MKILFGIGLVVLGLGIASLFVALPTHERHGLSGGGLSIGVTTQHDEKVSPVVSVVMMLSGAGLLIAAGTLKTGTQSRS